MTRRGVPPTLRAVVRWLAPGPRRDEVLGDLEESHARRSGRGAPIGTWLEGFGLVPHLLTERLRQAAEAARAATTGPAARLAVRANLRHPLLTLTALLALTVGTGLALCGHLLLEAVLRSELDVEGGDRFVLVEIGLADRAGPPVDFDGALLAALRRDVPELSYVGASQGSEANLFDGDGGVSRVRVAAITPSAFRHLSVEPRHGRTLVDGDGAPGAARVALASADFFRSRLGGDPSWIGRSLRVGRDRWTLVGVAPDGFNFPSEPDLWLPLDEGDLSLAGRLGDRRAFGILAADASIEASRERLRSVVEGHVAALGSPGTPRVDVRRFTDVLRGSTVAEVVFRGLVGVLVLILLVIAGNVANLMTARNAARARDIAIRRALGAGRGQIVAQLSLETLLLATVATVAGAIGAERLMAHFRAISTEMPYWVDFGLGIRGVVLAVSLALLTTLVGGTLPALRATRHPAAPPGTGRTVTGDPAFGPASSLVIGAQIAVSGALLLAAMLGAEGLARYADARVGGRASSVVTAQVVLPGAGDGRPTTIDALHAVVADLADDPDVAFAGLGDALPGRLLPARPVELEGSDGAPVGLRATLVHAGVGYLEAVTDAGVGRTFVAGDLEASAPRVAVISSSLRDASGGDAPALVGRRIRAVAPSGDPGPWAEIVGVVPDPGAGPEVVEGAGSVYLPFAVTPWTYLAVRPRGDPGAFAGALPARIARSHPEILVRRVALLSEVAEEDRKFMTALASALFGLGAVALLLSAAGLYAVTSFAVSRRTREIGIRLALGATGPGVVRVVGGRSARDLACGAAGAAVLGAGLLEIRRLFLFPIPDPDVALYTSVLGTLLLAGIAATTVPLRRALGIRPQEALRSE